MDWKGIRFAQVFLCKKFTPFAYSLKNTYIFDVKKLKKRAIKVYPHFFHCLTPIGVQQDKDLKYQLGDY